MRIWIFKVVENIPFQNTDVRLMRAALLSQMLSEQGHEVTWWVSSVNHQTKTYYPESNTQELLLPNNVKIVFLHSILYKRNISLKRLINHFGIARHFQKIAPQYPQPDVVICCFPTLEVSYAVVKFCKNRNIPVFVDIRDLYPDLYINLFPKKLRFIAKILFYPMTWLTKKALQGATGLTAISNTYLEWGLRLAKRAKHPYDRVFPLGYDKTNDSLLAKDPFIQKFKSLKHKKFILYVGSFINSIDLETVIKAAKNLHLFQNEEYHFILAGDGELKKTWEAMAAGLPNVTFTGWVNKPQINWLMQNSWVGLGAYKKDALMSLPNKIFEYMSAGLPILSSLEGETKDMIEKNGCGLYYEAGNPKSLITALEKLNNAPQEKESISKACLKTYLENYSSSLIYKDMIHHVTKNFSQ